MLFILVCATGRSGSTTLQRILSTIDDSHITGEKWGAVENLLECLHNIKRTTRQTPKYQKSKKFMSQQHLNDKRIKPCFYNTFEFTNVKENIKRTILSIIAPSNDKPCRVVGYKEIRWHNKLHLITEFMELFPNTKVICHIREDVHNQINSGWWKDNKDAKQHLQRSNHQLLKYSYAHNYCHLTHMSDLFDVTKMKNMFAFLNEQLDVAQYTHIIQNNFV